MREQSVSYSGTKFSLKLREYESEGMTSLKYFALKLCLFPLVIEILI